MRIIFLTYISRSGSTFLCSELDKSNEILSCPEADCLFDIFLLRPDLFIRTKQINRIKKLITNDRKFEAWGMKEIIENRIDFTQPCFNIFYQIIDYYRKSTKPIANTVIYKAESLFHVLSGEYLDYFTQRNIEIVSIVRDVRGVYYSQNKTRIPENDKVMSQNIIKTCLYWNSFVRKMILNFSGNNIVIKYEDLIRDYNNSLRRLAGNINIIDIPNQIVSELYQRLPESHKKIHENILLPPTKSIVNVWENKLSNNTIQFIEFISRKYLLKSGYTLKNHIDWLNLIYLLIVHSFMYIVFRLKKRLIFSFKKITHAFPYKELVF